MAVLDTQHHHKFWSIVSTGGGYVQTPGTEPNGLCTAIRVQSGYMVFILADPRQTITVKPTKWKRDQFLLDADLRWEVVAVPAGSTL
jgi:hypothetical protein